MKTLAMTSIVTGLLLMACGGGAASNEIEVTTTDFAFTPTEWTIPAGQTITVILTNKGTTYHHWLLMARGHQVTVPFDLDDIYRAYWEIGAAPGETTTATFVAPRAPGEYVVVCGAPGHLEQGMQARLIVKSSLNLTQPTPTPSLSLEEASLYAIDAQFEPF